MLNILFLVTFFALGTSCIYLWLQSARNLKAGQPLLENREFEFPFGFIDVIVMFIFWCLGQGLSLTIAVTVLKIDPGKLLEASGSSLAMLTIAVGLGQLVATLGAMAYLYGRYRSLSIFGWQPDNLRRDLIIGGVGFLMIVPVVLMVQTALTQFIEYKHATQQMLVNNADILTVFASWFSAVLVAPICEEIFFRGILQGFLQRLIPTSRANSDQKMLGGWTDTTAATALDSKEAPPKAGALNPYRSPYTAEDSPLHTSTPISYYWPILASAALFGLAHAGQGPAPIPLFLFGLALGYIFYRTGSIVACIVVHMLLNAFSMFWFTLGVFFPSPDSPTETDSEIVSLVEFQPFADYLLYLFDSCCF